MQQAIEELEKSLVPLVKARDEFVDIFPLNTRQTMGFATVKFVVPAIRNIIELLKQDKDEPCSKP